MAFENMPNAFQSAFQSNMLDTRFMGEIGANSKIRRVAARLPIPVRTGEQRIYTRAGDLVPVIAADNPTNNTLSYDLGLNAPGVGSTNNSYPIEQWNIFIAERSQSLDINVIQDYETLASFYRKNWDKLAKQAALSMDLMAVQQLAVSYESGSTFVTTSVGASATTVTVTVDNILGLSTAFATTTFNGTTFPYGLPASVATNNLSVTIYKAAGGSITGTVTNFTQDGSNVSTMVTPAGVVAGNSGTLTITQSASYAPQVGDVIVANDAPVVIRPNNRRSRFQLQTTDTVGMQLFINAKATLKNNGVDPLPDGTYACFLDDAGIAQVFTDPQFQIMGMGAEQSPIFVDGTVVRQFGLTFIPTTNTPIYGQVNAWSGSGSSPATNSRRAYVVGAGALQEGTFEGMAEGYRSMADQDLGYVRVLGPESDAPYALITRPALDRKAQIWSQTWVWIGGFACGTDATITSAVVPTANASRFKRAVTIEYAA